MSIAPKSELHFRFASVVKLQRCTGFGQDTPKRGALAAVWPLPPRRLACLDAGFVDTAGAKRRKVLCGTVSETVAGRRDALAREVGKALRPALRSRCGSAINKYRRDSFCSHPARTKNGDNRFIDGRYCHDINPGVE